MKREISKKFSAGVVPVFRSEENSEYRFLLLRAYNYWDFPKGMVMENEAPLEAAMRELEEETGLVMVSWNWGKIFTETEPYAGGKIARYYLGQVEREGVEIRPNPLLGRAEHHEYRWLLYKEAANLLVPRVQKVLDWAADKIGRKNQ